jgi:hypothetical protein
MVFGVCTEILSVRTPNSLTIKAQEPESHIKRTNRNKTDNFGTFVAYGKGGLQNRIIH